MASWIIRVVVILWQTIALSRASLSKLSCFEIFHGDKSALLTCPGGIIASVNVKSGRGSCTRSEGRCYGKTPSLLVNYYTCYWHHNCDVKWPSGLIYAAENGGNCARKRPTFMEISYKCFTKGQADETPERLLLDICDNLVDRRSVSVRAVTKNTSGLIRSHASYPWNYSNTRRFCSLQFYWPENQKLVITVHNIDLSEGDTLVLGNKTSHTAIRGGTMYFLNDVVTFFTFTVGTESNNGAGFVLCFKFTESTDSTVTDACQMAMDDGVFDTVHITPPPEETKSTPALTTEVTTSTPALTTTTEKLPKRCKRRKTEKARRRCVARYRKRRANDKKNKIVKKTNRRKALKARNKRKRIL